MLRSPNLGGAAAPPYRENMNDGIRTGRELPKSPARSASEEIRCPVLADGVQISVPVPVRVKSEDSFLSV